MAKNKTQTPRQRYTAEHHETARKMYLRGLYLSEIGVLLSIPVRTLEKWYTLGRWSLLKGCPDIKKRALELKRSGRTAKEVAEILQINPSTVFRWIKTAKNENNNEK
ncbi:MAG: helix-turn-helix domain-containing protein [Rikenellaceae bacterium]